MQQLPQQVSAVHEPWNRQLRRWQNQQTLMSMSWQCKRSKHLCDEEISMSDSLKKLININLLVNVICEFVVASKSHKSSQAETIWEENLRHRINPYFGFSQFR